MTVLSDDLVLDLKSTFENLDLEEEASLEEVGSDSDDSMTLYGSPVDNFQDSISILEDEDFWGKNVKKYILPRTSDDWFRDVNVSAFQFVDLYNNLDALWWMLSENLLGWLEKITLGIAYRLISISGILCYSSIL